jgi:predicted transcriptional regulator
MAKFAKGARVTGPARTKLADDVAKQYAKGKSIRELAEKNGRSYGFVHRLLVENNVTLRGRGGATRGKTRSSSKA